MTGVGIVLVLAALVSTASSYALTTRAIRRGRIRKVPRLGRNAAIARIIRREEAS